MKIGYYLGSTSLHSGGTTPYAWRVLNLLLSNSKKKNIKVLILCTKEVQRDCLELIDKYQAQAEISVLLHNFNLFQRLGKILEIILAKILDKLKLNNKLALCFNPSYRWLSSLDIDLLHIPYPTPPLHELPYPFIVTMHDVQELHFPEFFTPEERSYRAEHYWKSLKYACSVIVSFHHIKQDLIKYFNLSSSKVFICPLPYEHIKLSFPTKIESKIYAEKYSSLQNFILYPAQTWKHKNHLSLIKSLELIKERFGLMPNLICTGRQNPDFFPEISKYQEDSSVSKQVHFLGIVPESELYWLYKNCSCVVIPTLYEAGSFPLLEAMSLGSPVICSSVTSLPETINAPEFIFDPLDIEQMSNLIVKMLQDYDFRKSSIKNGVYRFEELKQINAFQPFLKMWSKTLEKE